MFEKWRQNLEKGGKCGILFIDLSKAFDSLQHDLAKANAYGFSYKSITFHLFYQEGEKYNLAYSNWEDFLIGLQQ